MSFTFCFQFFKVESSWSHGFLSKYMLKLLRSTCANHIEARKGACFLFVLSNYHAKEIMFLSHWKPINSRLWRKSLHKLPYYFKRIREHVQENHLNKPRTILPSNTFSQVQDVLFKVFLAIQIAMVINIIPYIFWPCQLQDRHTFSLPCSTN